MSDEDSSAWPGTSVHRRQFGIDPEINYVALEHVKMAIEDEPRQFIMGDFFSDTLTGYDDDHDEVTHVSPPNCGYAACIAGWAISHCSGAGSPKLGKALLEVYLPRWSGRQMPAGEQAQYVLGLTDAQRERLFFTSNWPQKFEEDYSDALDSHGDGSIEVAAVAIARIDHFIETQGTDGDIMRAVYL